MRNQEKIRELLNQEDKKNPWTDAQLAAKLKIKREQVTLIRKELAIKASKERLRPFLINDLRLILKAQPDISVRELTKKLQEKKYQVSRYLVNQELKKLNRQGTKKTGLSPNNHNQDPFQTIIGYNTSLAAQIQQAKAAILYPPHGLHTLIIGESGVGKSYLARKMFEFAKKQKNIDQYKFIIFNCADYADNPQLLYSHLFGHVKGAFTGAEKEKTGLISRANGGILFLDEVHRLSAEGQEMLFNVIDNGKYRRLGETEAEYQAKLMIIAATTEDLESSLLTTFRRRIPLVIELPSLKKRSLQEKLAFIKLFIAHESKKINKEIILRYEAGRVLLNYTPTHNIGQLESNLKVICAKAYLSFVTGVKTQVEIVLDILPAEIKRSFLNKPVARDEIRKLVIDDILIKPAPENSLTDREEKNIYHLTEDIYRYIEEKNQELSEIGISQERINFELTSSIEEKIKNLFSSSQQDFYKKNNVLKKLINQKIFNLINQLLVMLQGEMPELVLNTQLQYALAIHLDAVLQRIKDGKIIKYPNFNKIKDSYPDNFVVAEKIVNFLNQKCNITIPQDEIAYITMYLNTLTAKNGAENQLAEINIIVVSHGTVASSMLKVANWLLGGSKAKAVDMSLDEEPRMVLNQLISLAKKIDNGQGILLLVDMGSLTSFGEVIEEETGIKTKVVARVDTVMLMEAIRWSRLKDLSLDQLVNRLNNYNPMTIYPDKKEKVVLLYCITGEGAALIIKDYLVHRLPNLEQAVQIISIGVLDKDIEDYISNIAKEKDLVAIIGSLKPVSIESDRFFTIDEIYSEEGLKRFRKKTGVKMPNKVDIKLDKLIDKNLIFPALKVNSKDEVIAFLVKKLREKGVVKNGFLQAVQNKEKWGVTYIGSGIAIPHADNLHVNYSQIALAVMAKPIAWSGHQAAIICLFAIKDLGVEYFKLFHQKLIANFADIKQGKDILAIKKALLD